MYVLLYEMKKRLDFATLEARKRNLRGFGI